MTKTAKYETKKVACTGEAHRNEAGYDHCMVCLPEWGEITVCADCEHRPSQHAEDGCYGAKNDDDMTSARCECKHTFRGEGGKRTKLFTVEVRGNVEIQHGPWGQAERDYSWDKRSTSEIRTLNSGTAIRTMRKALRDEFANHIKDCPENNCRMAHASIETKGHSGTGGGYDRFDFERIDMAFVLKTGAGLHL